MKNQRLSLTSIGAIGTIAVLYGASYFTLVRVEHSPATGNATAEYPKSVEPVSVMFEPMESIDRQVRPDAWASHAVEEPDWFHNMLESPKVREIERNMGLDE
jgi:hypothetical protein